MQHSPVSAVQSYYFFFIMFELHPKGAVTKINGSDHNHLIIPVFEEFT